MVIKCYEIAFGVTETLNNGKEWRHRKTVLSPIFRNGKHIDEQERISDAKNELEKIGKYYNIEYRETKPHTIIIVGDYLGEA